MLESHTRQKWIIALFALFFLWLGIVRGDLFLILFIPGFIIFIVSIYWLHAFSPKNKIFLKERHFEIDNDFITAFLDDGTIEKLNLHNIISFYKWRNYFLLYISKGHFIYAPFRCFEKDSDIQELGTIVKKHLADQSS